MKVKEGSFWTFFTRLVDFFLLLLHSHCSCQCEEHGTTRRRSFSCHWSSSGGLRCVPDRWVGLFTMEVFWIIDEEAHKEDCLILSFVMHPLNTSVASVATVSSFSVFGKKLTLSSCLVHKSTFLRLCHNFFFLDFNKTRHDLDVEKWHTSLIS